MIQLPKKICVLDIETEEANFKDPEKSKLAFVGIKCYSLSNGYYKSNNYKYFYPSDLDELHKFLIEFDGIIIGHNVLNFDFRVLRTLISLNGIVDKTVDTLFFLYKKKGNKLGGLSLDDLCLVNFTKRKSFDARLVSRLWREGQYETVIKYNENDCDLTKELWQRLVLKKKIKIERGYDKETLGLDDNDVDHLTGINSTFIYSAWLQKIEARGGLFEKTEERIKVILNGQHIMVPWQIKRRNFLARAYKDIYFTLFDLKDAYDYYIKILYPFILSKNEVPTYYVGGFTQTYEKPGFYEIEYYQQKDKPPLLLDEESGEFRHNGKGFYCHTEIDKLLELGGNIKLIIGYVFIRWGNPFKNLEAIPDLSKADKKTQNKIINLCKKLMNPHKYALEMVAAFIMADAYIKLYIGEYKPD